MKDLTKLIENIENQIQEFYETKKRIGMGIVFVDPHSMLNNFQWVTNLSRLDGIRLLKNTVIAMKEDLYEQS